MASRKGQIFTRLVKALQEQHFLGVIRDFVGQHIAMFQDIPSDSEEHRLEWTELHQQYQALFDAQAAEVLDREGLDSTTVVELCAAITGNQPGGGPLATFLEWSTASTDYLAFLAMMRRGTAPYRAPENARAEMLTTLLLALEEPRFQSEVLSFISENHKAFAGSDDFRKRNLHKSFRSIFEAHLTDVLARDHLELADLGDLVKSVRATGDAEISRNLDSCLKTIYAHQNYEIFCSLMLSVREGTVPSSGDESVSEAVTYIELPRGAPA